MSHDAATTPEWIALLRAERARGKRIADIAREVGIPRPSLSMLINGTYPASLEKVTAKFSAAVLRQYREKLVCPYLGEKIEPEECAEFAALPMTMSSPLKLRHWRACQICEHNPDRKENPYAC